MNIRANRLYSKQIATKVEYLPGRPAPANLTVRDTL